MLKIILGKLVKKYGVKGALLKAGDWAKVKKVLKDA